MVDTDKNTNFNIILNHFNDLNICYPSKQYLKERIYDESNDLIQIVDCLRSNNVEHMRLLNQKGIKFGHFKEFNARMAIYYNNVNMLIYLIESKQINKDLNILFNVNLKNQTFSSHDGDLKETFEINEYNKTCLINGYDNIDFLLSQKEKILNFESRNEK